LTIAAKEAPLVQTKQLLLAQSVSGPSTKLTTSPVAASPVATPTATREIDVVKVANVAKQLENLTSGTSLPVLSLAFQMVAQNDQQRESERHFNQQEKNFNQREKHFQTVENRTLSKEAHDAKVIDLGFLVRVDTSSRMATFAFPVLLAIAVTGALLQCCKKDASDPSTILKTAVIIYVVGMLYVAAASSSWLVAWPIIGGTVLGIVFFAHAFSIHFHNMNQVANMNQVPP